MPDASGVADVAAPAGVAGAAGAAPERHSGARNVTAGSPNFESPPVTPIDPIQMLEQIYLSRTSDHQVTVSLQKNRVRINRDPLRFAVRSSRAGHVYVMMVGTDRSHFTMLFPNAIDSNNRIDADRPLALPRPGWRMDAAGPPGTDHFVVLVSAAARDFDDAGLRRSEPFAEFPLSVSRSRYDDGLPVFAGRARCGKTVGACPQAYGAALFSIEEIMAR